MAVKRLRVRHGRRRGAGAGTEETGAPVESNEPAFTGGPPTPYGLRWSSGGVPNGRMLAASWAPSSSPVGIAMMKLTPVFAGFGKNITLAGVGWPGLIVRL